LLLEGGERCLKFLEMVAIFLFHRYGELWCNAYELADKSMRAAKQKPNSVPKSDEAVRASISFPRELYQTLEEIARQKKVSLAWVVRDAAEQYVSDRWPLFRGQV
jgi:hypothetical protein